MPEDKPKSNRGGARPGAGRKPVSEEMKSRELAQSAIKKKYGTIEDGMIALLNTNEPTLVKFVWEHAQGKPTDKIDLTSRIEETRIIDVDDDGNEEDDDEVDEYNEFIDGTEYDKPENEDE